MPPHGEGKSTKPREKVLASAGSAVETTDKGHHPENERVRRTPHSQMPAVKALPLHHTPTCQLEGARRTGQNTEKSGRQIMFS